MAENSRKNEFFERESIAIIAITTNSSISVNKWCFSFCIIRTSVFVKFIFFMIHPPVCPIHFIFSILL